MMLKRDSQSAELCMCWAVLLREGKSRETDLHTVRHIALSIFCAYTLTHLNGKHGRPSVVRCDVISRGVVMSWVPAVGGKMLHDIRDPFFLVSPLNTHFRSFPFYYKETEVKSNL